jgi:hypothetical protein
VGRESRTRPGGVRPVRMAETASAPGDCPSRQSRSNDSTSPRARAVAVTHTSPTLFPTGSTLANGRQAGRGSGGGPRDYADRRRPIELLPAVRRGHPVRVLPRNPLLPRSLLLPAGTIPKKVPGTFFVYRVPVERRFAGPMQRQRNCNVQRKAAVATRKRFLEPFLVICLLFVGRLRSGCEAFP